MLTGKRAVGALISLPLLKIGNLAAQTAEPAQLLDCGAPLTDKRAIRVGDRSDGGRDLEFAVTEFGWNRQVNGPIRIGFNDGRDSLHSLRS